MPEDEREGRDEEDPELELEESQSAFSTLTIVFINCCLCSDSLEISLHVLTFAEENRGVALLSRNVV